MSYKGVDVSFYQGDINWKSVEAAGIQFAMIRASYGSDGVDSKFVENINDISKTSIARGAYHYCYALSKEEAVVEADHFLNTIKLYKFNYPLALDFEYETLLSLSKKNLSEIALAFCDTVEKAGYYAIIYSNLNWLVNYLDMSVLNRFDIWLAQWGPQPTFSEAFGMWQYSSTGSVAGIIGDVDLDISYRDYPSIIEKNKLNGPNNFSEGPQPTEPDDSSIPVVKDTFNYTVKDGDNLWDISQRFLGSGTKYPEIVSLNNLSSTTIYPGQVLKIPESNSSNSPEYKTYTVVEGDNLWDIAQRFLGAGARYSEIALLNNLNSDTIYPGQTLKIPD